MSASWEIREGDCCALMAAMPEASVDAIVCDPPYLIGFMGKEFDSQHKTFVERRSNRRAGSFEAAAGNHNPEDSEDLQRTRLAEGRRAQAWHERWAREALRVLKPGGFLLAAGGTRTYHRLVCAVEDAGFEIRDRVLSLGGELGSELDWIYGSGFPKSLDVSKAIDKAAGAEREVVAEGRAVKRMIPGADQNRTGSWIKDNGREFVPMLTAPATPEAEAWSGFGTALKPAHEPIVVARKPLAGTVAGNVLAHGTGAININGCRVGYEAGGSLASNPSLRENIAGGNGGHIIASETERRFTEPHGAGRWPANVVLSHADGCVLVGERQTCVPGCAVRMLDEQTGPLPGGTPRRAEHGRTGSGVTFVAGHEHPGFGDQGGGASRFFYTAKASTAERGPDNKHPTVKPVDLMCWLVRLVTPPGGLVLDPFTGSGTTGIAALREGFSFIGLEREPEYVTLARRRIIDDAPLLNAAAEVAA